MPPLLPEEPPVSPESPPLEAEPPMEVTTAVPVWVPSLVQER